MLAQVRKLVTKNAKKTQKNQFGLNGQTKQKMPKIPESRKKIRKPKINKTIKKQVRKKTKPENPKTNKPMKRTETKNQKQIGTNEKTVITKKN